MWYSMSGRIQYNNVFKGRPYKANALFDDSNDHLLTKYNTC